MPNVSEPQSWATVMGRYLTTAGIAIVAPIEFCSVCVTALLTYMLITRPELRRRQVRDPSSVAFRPSLSGVKSAEGVQNVQHEDGP